MLKKEDWGGLTILSLLAVFAFPPYFIQLMAMAALSEFGHLYTTMKARLEADQSKFQAFEKEFRKGYQMEKSGNLVGAVLCYRSLEKEYAALPQAARLATLQIQKIEKTLPVTVPSPVKKKTAVASKASPKKKQPPARRRRKGKV